MPSTYEPIATTTLGSNSNSVIFNSIPSTYTDLVLIFDGLNVTSNNYDTFIRFNSISTNTYSYTVLLGSGSSAFSYRGSSQNAVYVGNTNTSRSNSMIVQIHNYANTNVYKTLLSRINNSTNVVGANVGLWSSTSAISSMEISSEKGSGSFAAGSTFTLYGIKAA
jgi:hypothetical protein